MRSKRWLISALATLLCFPFGLHAQSWALNSFEAEFAVRLMGFNVGKANHHMQCTNLDCELISIANPPNWAKRFINESSTETIKLVNNEQQLTWMSYHKDLTRRYSDRTVNIITDLIYNPAQQRIEYPQKNREWPAHLYAYDMVSIVYALQFYAQQNIALPALILQDEEQQQPVKFSVINRPTKTHLNYKSNVSARFYQWNTSDHEVKIWLIEELDLFPGRIEFHHKKANRRVTLSLASPPKHH